MNLELLKPVCTVTADENYITLTYSDYETSQRSCCFPKKASVRIITLLRTLPHKILINGDDGSGGWPDWERSVKGPGYTIAFINISSDRGLDHLELFTYYDGGTKRSAGIRIAYESTEEGFDLVVEPVLMQLEKFLSDEERDSLPPPRKYSIKEKEQIIKEEKAYKQKLEKKNQAYGKDTGGVIVRSCYKNRYKNVLCALTFKDGEFVREDSCYLLGRDLTTVITCITASLALEDTGVPFYWEKKGTKMVSLSITYDESTPELGMITLKSSYAKFNTGREGAITIPVERNCPVSTDMIRLFYAANTGYRWLSFADCPARTTPVTVFAAEKKSGEEILYIKGSSERIRMNMNDFITVKNRIMELKEVIDATLAAPQKLKELEKKTLTPWTDSIVCSLQSGCEGMIAEFELYDRKTGDSFRIFSLFFTGLSKRLTQLLQILPDTL